MFRKFLTRRIAVLILGFFCISAVLLWRTESADVSRIGDRGGEVYLIQRRLIELGYLDGEASGVFDTATSAAMRRFQLDEGLDADGAAGEAEIDALGIYADNSLTLLTVGSSGAQVLRLQRELKRLGYYDGELTGVYGSLTAQAVRKYRKENGLYVNGDADGELLYELGLNGGESEPYDGGKSYRTALLARFIETLIPDGTHREMVNAALDILHSQSDEPTLSLKTTVSLAVKREGKTLRLSYSEAAERAARAASALFECGR